MNRRLMLITSIVLVTGVLILFVLTKITKRRDAEKEPEVPEKPVSVVALVLDDFGYSKKNFNVLKELNVPFTMAVLPNLAHSYAVCSFAEENGKEVILHLPMEPLRETNSLEKDTIGTEMDDVTVRDIMANAFRSVPTAIGVSNHMGSKATADDRLMKVALGNLKERGMFFLDSFTTRGSICRSAAAKTGVPYIRRDVFIDNKLEREYIRQQMKKVEEIALGTGSAIAMGHDRSVTVSVLREIIPEMREKGIRFIKLSEVVKLRQ